jgi:cytochrome c5
MKIRPQISAALLAMAMLLAAASLAWAGSKTSKDSATTPATASAPQDESLHLEGEKRFRSNCSRCHAAPPRFSPRMMATIVRHMRVRANITDQEMRLILRYMAE